MKIFPLDLFTYCENFNSSNYLNEFDYLNVKKFRNSNLKIYKKFYSLLDDTIYKLNKKNRHLIYCDFQIINSFLHSLYYNVAINTLANTNTKVHFDKNGLVSKYSKFEPESFNFNKKQNNNKFKNFIKDIYLNKNKFFFYKKKYLTVGSLSHLKKQFSNKENILLINKSENFFLDINKFNLSIDNELENYIKNIITEFNNFLLNELNFSFDEKKILNIFIQRLSFLNNLYLNIEKEILTKFDGIILESPMNPIFRVVCAVFKNNEKDAISLDHGYQNHEIFEPIELMASLVSNVRVCFNFHSQKNLENYSKTTKDYFSYDRKKLKFDNCSASLYKKFYNKFPTKKILKKKKKLKILVSGYPLSHWVLPEFPKYHFYEKIYLELKIANFLSLNGVESFYKIHPDRNYKYLHKVLNFKYDHLIEQKFEQLNFNDFDAVIHTYTLGRPFWYSLFKDIPIILIDNDIEDHWFNFETKKLLSQRCSLIKYSDKMNAPGFDELEMKKVLNQIKSGNLDYNFDYSKLNLK